MNDLDQQPDFLADLIPVPAAPGSSVQDDVARGERALRRRRLLTGAGSAAAVAVIAGTVAWAGAGSTPRAQETPYAGSTTSAAPSAKASHATQPHVVRERTQKRGLGSMHRFQEQIKDSTKTIGVWRDVLDEHLSAYGTLQRYDGFGFSGSGSDFGTKLDWNNGGLLQFVVGPHWNAIQGGPGAPVPPLEPRTYQGMEARVGEANGVLVVSVKHDDGTVVTLLAATSFGNNGTTTSSLGLTVDDLLEAAADPRISNPPGR